jgi:hypothetical protein
MTTALAVSAACAVVFALTAWAVLRRIHVSVSLQGSGAWGDDGGTWSFAGGGEIGVLQVSAARMHGGVSAWQVHLFGRSLARSAGTATTATTARDATRESRASRWRARAWRWMRRLDPALAVELGLDAFAHVRVEALEARVRCAAVDPLLAGRVAGALAVVSGALAPVAKIDGAIDWSAEEDALDVKGELAASFVPLVLTCDLARFVLRHAFSFASRSSASSALSPAASSGASAASERS